MREKRKRERAVSEADKALKSPRLAVAGKSLNVQATADSPSDSSESSEETTSSSDSAGDSGRCRHMRLDSGYVDTGVYEIKNSEVLPTCHYPGCGVTWKGAGKDKEGMMKCIYCPYISCAQGVVKEDPQGHARLHAIPNSKHYIAQWYDEPNLGYCFKCECVMRLSDNQDQWSEDECAEVDRKVNDERGMVASKTKDQRGIVASNTEDDCGIGVSNAKVDIVMVDRNSKVDASNALDQYAGNHARRHASEFALGNGCIIRGMPNHGNTCYMNASLQCLLVLCELRTMILSPDARLGDLGQHLKLLFVETSCENNARHMLDPNMIVEYMLSRYPERFSVGKMEDSHEFITSLREALDNEVLQLNISHVMHRDGVFPTFGLSIFKGRLTQTVSYKRCSHTSVTYHSLDGLELAVPSKDPPARSKPLQFDSCEALGFIPSLFDDFEEMEESAADSHNPEDKVRPRGNDIVHDEAEHINYLGSIEDCLTLFFNDRVDRTNCENCSKVAELLETNGSKNVEPIMAITNVNTTVDGDQTELSDRKASPNERSSDFNSLLVESPSRQPFCSDSHHEFILSDDTTTAEITAEMSCKENDLASCNTANEKVESREGVQKAAPSCLPTDEQTDLPSAQDIQDTSTQKQGSGNHVLGDDSSQQVDETQNEQTDDNGSAIRKLISKLPPVLTIQLKRYASYLSKLKGHVSFPEILQLERFMEPRTYNQSLQMYHIVFDLIQY